MKDPGRVIVIGAGPTGLGAAWRLAELGVGDYLVLEARDTPGGLASSHRDEHGFTWDVGGHVQFSHYDYYDDVLDRVVTCGWLEHERRSWIRVCDRWVPYPFQHNLHRLPRAAREACVAGLEAAVSGAAQAPRDLREWVVRTFGRGIADVFLLPYNRKVWGYAPETLDATWTAHRVATPDLERVRRNVRERRDDVSWGANRAFRFPMRGGTGRIWRSLAATLPADRVRYDAAVTSVDVEARRVRLEDGRVEPFDRLLSTMPLDRLCAIATGVDAATRKAAAALVHSSVHVLGVGLRGDRPEHLRNTSWMYFPEPASPYHRVTVFSNYSPAHCPPGNDHWSLMAEVCETRERPVEPSTVERATLDALRRDGLLGERTRIVGVWHRREEYGYPTPFLGRDAVLAALRRALEPKRVWSRGRFGAWRYEVSNQDHSFMQGVELVDRWTGNGDEPTLEESERVHRGDFRRGTSSRDA